MALKLSFCQLIKIVLSQIGGSPLQQVYSQLSQGLQQITKGGIIPSEFAQLKTFIDQVTTALNGVNGVGGVVNDINAMQELTKQFFYNPVETVTNESVALIDTRLAQISEDLGSGIVPTSGNEAEYDKLLAIRSNLLEFKGHTNILSGATPPSTTGGFGGCTLADLLGSGCSPAADVPDIDLQVLVDGFKSGAILNQFKTNLSSLIANQTGYAQLSVAINNLQSSIVNFNTTVTSKLNKIVIQKAVETYITNLAFNLLSGCSSPVVNATIRPTAKSAIAPFVEYYQKIQNGVLNADGSTPGANNTTLAT
jgi:hypothetical protein